MNREPPMHNRAWHTNYVLTKGNCCPICSTVSMYDCLHVLDWSSYFCWSAWMWSINTHTQSIPIMFITTTGIILPIFPVKLNTRVHDFINSQISLGHHSHNQSSLCSSAFEVHIFTVPITWINLVLGDDSQSIRINNNWGILVLITASSTWKAKVYCSKAVNSFCSLQIDATACSFVHSY